ncbi:penicillin-binding protein [Bhargavaea cecembensis]|uniref:Penicillin-binding protein n=1 Tax=Bhargavaea cecembensis TaxID=394098 RepID=A0A163FDT6_9BACL|nr:PBP1A family penicillin-binding protein [Bhargavaea cecembensis]KZE38467.1 penicillin-binding protein [Bhargavaea cecembensis]
MKRAHLKRQRKRRTLVKRLLLLSLSLGVAGLVMYGAFLIYIHSAGPPSLKVPNATVFLDRNGDPIGDRHSGERRYWASLDDMSPFLADAFVAVEDKDFYEHKGFDYSRIASAVLKDVKSFRKAEGASTITQQYARNLFLTHQKTWTRKINEAVYARRIETFYDKDTILEGYLNTVYFGHGMYGAEAASKFFFGKEAKDLTLAEATLMAAVPKGPSVYSPVDHPEAASDRQKIILNAMIREGYVTREQADHALNQQIALKHDQWDAGEKVAPYFLDEVWREAEKRLDEAGRDIAEGGWTIRTTLDPFHQKSAEAAADKWMPDNGLQFGFITMKPDSGQITSLIGGRDYAASPFNRVTQAERQSGSAMKPVLYAAALEQGFTPLTFLKSEPTVFTFDDGRQEYEPKNVNGKFAERPISLAQALAISDNIYAVKTLEEIGYKPFKDMAARLGITGNFVDAPATALGTTEVTLYEMTGAYNRIASGGMRVVPTTIQSITDASGETVYRSGDEDKEQREVLDPADAFVLTQMMTGMFDPVFSDYTPSTGLSMRPSQTRPYAAKSGTTLSDQYLIGFSTSLTAGIWAGFDEGRRLTENSDKMAAKKMWIEFMEDAHAGLPPEPFAQPEGVTGVIVDVDTGGLAVEGCGKQRLVYVKERNVPRKLCTDPALRQERSKDTKDGGPIRLFPFSFFD